MTRFHTMLFCSAALLPSALQAQEATGSADIIVTAQKRSENLLDVPLSLSVIGGEALADRRIERLEDLTRNVPNLAFNSAGGAGLANLSIRGIASEASNSTVGLYLDDAPITVRNIFAIGASEPRFFDLARVEVLRGPQGTLYGASSMGGTIRFISNAPDTSEFGATVSARLATTKGGELSYQASAAVNVPLVADKLAVRVGALAAQDGGYIDRYDPVSGDLLARNGNDVKPLLLQAAVLATPTEDFTITASAFYQRTRTGDADNFETAGPRFETRKALAETGRDTLFIPSLKLEYDFGFASLTSISSYFQRRFERTVDGGALNSQYIAYVILPTFGLDGTPVAPLVSPIELESRNDQFTQEFRLASNDEPGQRFSWSAGVYYSNGKFRLTDDERVIGMTDTFVDSYGLTPEELFGAPFPDDLVYFSDRTFRERQIALFGEIGLRILPELKLTAGLRYSDAKTSLDVIGDGFFAGGFFQIDGEDESEDAFTPRFTLSYEPSDSLTLYANIAKGFRLGSPNRPVPADLCAADIAAIGGSVPEASSSDSLWSYEAGFKGRTPDRKFSGGVSAFVIDWSNIQQNLILFGCGFDVNVNAGDARSYGAEFEMELRPADGLMLGFSGGFTNAKLTNGVPSVAGSVSGARLPFVPRWTLTGSGEYRTGLSDGVEGVGRLDVRAIGRSNGSFDPASPDFRRPSYVTVGASVGADAGPLTVRLFVDNLLDEDRILQRPNVTFLDRGYTLRPRTVGLSGSYRF